MIFSICFVWMEENSQCTQKTKERKQYGDDKKEDKNLIKSLWDIEGYRRKGGKMRKDGIIRFDNIFRHSLAFSAAALKRAIKVEKRKGRALG